MPNIIPYKAFVYNSKLATEIENLVSPPYDVISPSQHLELVERHPYNSVGLCLADSVDDPNRYRQMKARLEDWKTKGIFETIDTPAFYLLEENFTVEGQARRRIGFVGLLEVSPFDRGEVLPHEHTLSGPKKDRLELLKTMRAELSQIFLCYQDSKMVLEEIYSQKAKEKPFRELSDPTGVHRKLWLIQSASEIETICNLIADHPLLIADGHHRYETTLAFQKEDGSVNCKYAQCYFTNLATPGFSILPIHRLFSLPPEMAPAEFHRKLNEVFEVREFEMGLDLEALTKLKTTKPDTLHLLCAFRNEKQILLLSRKKETADDAEIFAIQNLIFEKILEWDLQKVTKGVIQYEHETADFQNTLSQLSYGVGLFLPPTDLGLVMRLARDGKRMPQKSTFFYPKLASGLVNYELGSF